MFDFVQLVRNENMKIYRRTRTWIMFGMLLVLTLAISIAAYAFPDGNLPSMWMAFQINTMLGVNLITIFAVIIAAETVAGEFSTGTIKLLLIRPWTRSKILLSKYISLVLFAFLFVLLLLVWNFVLNWLLFGSDTEARMGVDQLPALNFFLQYHGYEFISMIMVVTLSFLVSTVFRSGSFAIGLSIFLLFGGQLLTGILSLMDYPWVKYVLFLNLRLSDYLSGGNMFGRGEHDLTLGFSLSVLAVYYVIFILITWYIFKKRDVAT
ncbi:ABC transporter permease [Paenibacillus sp. GCM10012307]|uniref:ABC transporter permease n=1 Tax=Paenibacillus roseus TaxID=2798579 RepID=A0A934MNV9_9BACL|nr:ABC transporter permease [Paenibacillus roseus]MBJ6360233.1 ABC transporter permease [Paenibacillus roseus]